MEAILYTAAFVFFAVCFIHWRIVERRDRLARESKARATLSSDTAEFFRISATSHDPSCRGRRSSRPGYRSRGDWD